MSGSRGQSFDVDHYAVRGRTLKVSWETSAGDYGAAKLRGIFESFGIVEDVVIPSKKEASAFIVMTSREAAVRAVHNMSREIRNPLFVVPLEHIGPINNVIGADFMAFVKKIFQEDIEKKRFMK